MEHDGLYKAMVREGQGLVFLMGVKVLKNILYQTETEEKMNKHMAGLIRI